MTPSVVTKGVTLSIQDSGQRDCKNIMIGSVERKDTAFNIAISILNSRGRRKAVPYLLMSHCSTTLPFLVPSLEMKFPSEIVSAKRKRKQIVVTALIRHSKNKTIT